MRIREQNTMFDVCLVYDGTLDTVISVQPVAPRRPASAGWDAVPWPIQEVRYSDTSDHRDANGALTTKGFSILAHDAASGYWFDE